MIDANSGPARLPLWVWVAAGLGAAWNGFGLVQLTDFLSQTRASLMMKGMSPAAADLYYALPIWMKLAFAVGSIGGLLGSIALAGRRDSAVPIFGTSLLGYVGLYAGDYAYGVFAAIPGQMGILSAVVAIAIGLLSASVVAKRRALLG